MTPPPHPKLLPASPERYSRSSDSRLCVVDCLRLRALVPAHEPCHPCRTPALIRVRCARNAPMDSVATFMDITDLFEWHSLHPGLDSPEIGHPVRAANHISLRLSSLFQPIDLATP